MANLKKDALEQLRLQVEAAQAAANADPIWTLTLEELRAKAETHILGVNASGWENPYPTDDPRHLYLEYQFRNHHDRSRFKLSLQGRQTGKDFTMQGEAVEDCHARKTEWMFAAPSERQALDSLSQGKLWAEAYELYIEDFKMERESAHPQSLLKAAEIIFSNGSKMAAVPGKPDTVRGRSANIGLTEFDFFENPKATWRAILPSITNPLRGGEKKVRICTTPNGKGGAMFKLWSQADTPKMRWSRHKVSIYHAVLMGLPVDIAQLRAAMDDPEGFAQECEVEFLDSSSVLLPYEIIALAESIDASEFVPAEFWENPSHLSLPLVCGVDFGRTNDPTVCWSLQMVAPNLWTTVEVLVLRDMPAPLQQAILDTRFRRASAICYDYTGPGIGLGDYLAADHGIYDPAAHTFGKLELATFTAAFKREIFPRLRRAFEAPTRLRIPISIDVREDLHAVQQIISNGNYSYQAPRTAEGHSDRCTALALAWRATERAGLSLPPMPYRGGRGPGGPASGYRSAHHARRAAHGLRSQYLASLAHLDIFAKRAA